MELKMIKLKNKYVIGNIGDRRVYSYNNKNILQITKDHSAIHPQDTDNLFT